MEGSESSFKLQDRTAILTGPCTTYNQAIAQRLTQLGTYVVMIDRGQLVLDITKQLKPGQNQNSSGLPRVPPPAPPVTSGGSR